jgi:hypothetical protein
LIYGSDQQLYNNFTLITLATSVGVNSASPLHIANMEEKYLPVLLPLPPFFLSGYTSPPQASLTTEKGLLE